MAGEAAAAERKMGGDAIVGSAETTHRHPPSPSSPPHSYDATGKKVRGPAPLSLALAHAEVNDDVVFFSPWTETDFRTGLAPWWK